VEARRTFCTYRDLVRRELGVEPSATFLALARGPSRLRVNAR
jgi:hypothetical protein